ncbi:hypothetical protein [Shewanella colwelliana]|uniref:hypothetical protein n=1 Tax=Shewanella colwelliana TaxID=23 RepID=UPI0022AF688C|nr:hypothetical protein [Shewanella colwelliana]MCZ4336124.1 hypothetical protein [Shewanella colwelliana]
MDRSPFAQLSLSIAVSLLYTLLSHSNVMAAEIVDYKPNCIAQTIRPVSLSITSSKYQAPQKPEQSQAFKDALERLRQIADERGADTILLTDVRNSVINSSKTSALSAHSDRKEIKTSQLRTHLQAQLFTQCADDKTFSAEAAPFSHDGYKLQRIEFEYTFEVPEIKSAANLAASIDLPPAVVSLETGVYGAQLGMSKAQVLALLGPASIEIPAQNHLTLWGYGRHIWLVFQSSTLISISSESDLLTAYGRNLIEFREGFDDTLWSVQNLLPQKASRLDADKQLDRWITRRTDDTLTLTGKGNQLALTFETFHPDSASDPQSLLTGFTLSEAQSHSVKQPQTDRLNLAQKDWLMTHLAPQYHGKRPLLTQFQQQFPHMTKLAISGSGEWWIIGNLLQVQFDDEQLRKTKLSQGVFQAISDKQFSEEVSSLAIPTLKQGLLAQYTDATDNFDAVDIYRDKFAIFAKYDSYDDDALLYEVEIDYF